MVAPQPPLPPLLILQKTGGGSAAQCTYSVQRGWMEGSTGRGGVQSTRKTLLIKIIHHDDIMYTVVWNSLVWNRIINTVEPVYSHTARKT